VSPNQDPAVLAAQAKLTAARQAAAAAAVAEPEEDAEVIAQREFDAAKEAAAARVRAGLENERRVIMPQVVTALRAALAAMGKVQAIDRKECDVFGFCADAGAFLPMTTNDLTGESLVEEWIARMRERKLYDGV
jgi:hypothetical protein